MELITTIIISSSILIGFISNYLLKSRCTTIEGCGCKIQRDVIPSNELNNIKIPKVPTQL